MGINIFNILRLGDYSLRQDRHILSGVVEVNEVPTKRLIIVFDRLTKTFIASTLSDPTTGFWEIKNIPEYPERSLFVVAFDDTGEFNSIMYDYISQGTYV